MEISTIKNRNVTAEVTCLPGIGIHLVGIPDNYVKTTLLRVVTAMQECGYHIPGKKVVINVILAPGFKLDEYNDWWLHLPVALGIIRASGQAAFTTEPEAPAFRMAMDGHLSAYVPGALLHFIDLYLADYDADNEAEHPYTLTDLVESLCEYSSVMELKNRLDKK